MHVPFFDMKAELCVVRADLDAAIARVLDSGILIGGPEVTEFERELAAATGSAHAIGVSSGTDALHALGMALGIGAGDEIVTTPLTFFATAGAFARLGARIVFADIDDETLCLDPAAASTACSDRTRAVVVVNLFGRPSPLPSAAPCPVLEDAAQSIGACGVRALASTLSFFPTKNLGAIGDAGAVLTNDPDLAGRLRLVRSHGAPTKYHHVALGGNFRLDAIQAAVLRAKLPRLENVTEARREHARTYRRLFATARVPPEVRLPPDDASHVYHQFVIRAPRRDVLRRFLAEQGIGTEVYYPEPLHLQPIFARGRSLPRAERACRELVALPIHPQLTVDSLERVVATIERFFS